MMDLNASHKCDNPSCASYASYIRIRKKWTRVGTYHTGCKTVTVPPEVRLERYSEEDIESIRRINSQNNRVQSNSNLFSTENYDKIL